MNGLHCSKSEIKDPAFLAIGQTSIIAKRDSTKVPVNPNGTLGEYVPFYFGPRSPMLCKIWKKGADVPQTSQLDIIYLVSTIAILEEKNKEYVFTDTNASAAFVNFFSREEKEALQNLDWLAIYAKYWSNSESDLYKKQAECLVLGKVELNLIKKIYTYNQEVREKVSKILAEKGVMDIIVKVRSDFYYTN